jgi:hypothetical protein
MPITEAIRDAQEGLRQVMKTEIHLAATELKTGALGLTHRSKLLLAFAGLAIWGVLPLTAFAVIGLGVLLGDGYWLSSLILAAFALIVGVIGVMSQIKKAKEEDLSMRRTRRTLNRKLRRVV